MNLWHVMNWLQSLRCLIGILKLSTLKLDSWFFLSNSFSYLFFSYFCTRALHFNSCSTQNSWNHHAFHFPSYLRSNQSSYSVNSPSEIPSEHGFSHHLSTTTLPKPALSVTLIIHHPHQPFPSLFISSLCFSIILYILFPTKHPGWFLTK